MYDNLSKVIEVDINEILPNRFQPRIQFDENEILELSDSIREHGVIQPIVVRTIGDKYEIIAGERRYKASVLAGKETVPVIVKNLNDKDSAEIALIENIQRKNLTPIEEALSYKKILDMGYITQENLASKLGKSQSAVANKIRLLNLSDEVQEALLENKISERHARSLLRLSISSEQNKMLNRIISERLTVRRTDEEIDKLKNMNESIDGSNDSSQKIIEKEEINMNNNMYGIPNIPQNQPSNQVFDIFGTGNQASIETQPVVEPQMPSMGGMSFDANGVVTNAQSPVAPVQPVVEPQVPSMGGINFDANGVVTNVQSPVTPVQPVVEQQVPSMGGINFDANGVVTNVQSPVSPVQPVAEPQVPSMGGINFDANGVVTNVQSPVTPVQPVVEQQVPSMGGINFDANGVVTNVQSPVSPVQPVAESQIISNQLVPETSPIIDNSISPIQPIIADNSEQMNQQSDNLFSFGNSDELSQNSPSIPTQEFKMPEPIIITDYSKQYDPVMPQTIEEIKPQIDFKEVINIIRECSSKIEQYGYKIDVEEYDLANLYQVVFKIEK